MSEIKILRIVSVSVLCAVMFCRGAYSDQDALSLEECLNTALQNHPSLRQAKGQIRAAEAQLEQTRAGNRVTVTGTGSLGYNGDYEEWSDRYHSESVGLAASKTLYDTGRNRLQKEIQRENLKGAKQNERQYRAKVASTAKKAYYDLVLKLLNRDVEIEKLHNLEEHLKSAKGHYEVGNSAFIDVTRAEADAASARVSLLKAENDILVSQEALKVAMGISGAGTFNIVLSTELLLPQPAGNLEELLKTALEDRPDYLQALHTLKAKELGVTSAARDGSPTVTGQLTSSLSKREGASSAEDYGVRINLSVPIVDGGATAAAVELARAQVDQQSAAVESLKQDIAFSVRSAAMSLTNAVQRVQSSEASVKYAEENLEIAQGRYDVGVGNAIELSDAVSQLASARYIYYQSLYDAQSARADLDEAMGHLPPELNKKQGGDIQ